MMQHEPGEDEAGAQDCSLLSEAVPPVAAGFASSPSAMPAAIAIKVLPDPAFPTRVTSDKRIASFTSTILDFFN